MNKVFFVVPVYNVEKYLKRCVDSIKAQTYKNTYTILVDDGATDKSGKMCDEFADGFDNFEVIHKRNGGLSDARNAGIKRALELGDKDDYMVLLDSDDYVRDTYAERLVDISKKHNAQMVQCAHEKGSSDNFNDKNAKVWVKSQDKRDALLGYMLKTQVTIKLYKLSLFENELFPVGRINEDEFIIYRLAYKCDRIAFTNEKLYYYFQHEGSIMSDIAKKLKDSPRRLDWLYAYMERIEFFQERKEHELVLRTYEKICTDIILRYTEQMRLPKADRDSSVVNGEYIRTYRNFYKLMIKRKGIPLKKYAMYVVFNIFPYSSCIVEKFTQLRK